MFHSESAEIVVVVHGDDFTCMGYEEELLQLRRCMEGWYDIKMRGVMGDDLKDVKQIVILNRTLTWTGN